MCYVFVSAVLLAWGKESCRALVQVQRAKNPPPSELGAGRGKRRRVARSGVGRDADFGEGTLEIKVCERSWAEPPGSS